MEVHTLHARNKGGIHSQLTLEEAQMAKRTIKPKPGTNQKQREGIFELPISREISEQKQKAIHSSIKERGFIYLLEEIVKKTDSFIQQTVYGAQPKRALTNLYDPTKMMTDIEPLSAESWAFGAREFANDALVQIKKGNYKDAITWAMLAQQAHDKMVFADQYEPVISAYLASRDGLKGSPKPRSPYKALAKNLRERYRNSDMRFKEVWSELPDGDISGEYEGCRIHKEGEFLSAESIYTYKTLRDCKRNTFETYYSKAGCSLSKTAKN